MPVFAESIYLRLHPLHDNHYANSCLREGKWKPNAAGTSVNVEIETAGWSKAILSLRAETFWTKHPDATSLIVTMTHYDGSRDRFVLGRRADKFREDAFCEHILRLAPRDGYFSGSISVRIEMGSNTPMHQRSCHPTYMAMYHYKPSRLSDLGMQDRIRGLYLGPSSKAARRAETQWFEFKGQATSNESSMITQGLNIRASSLSRNGNVDNSSQSLALSKVSSASVSNDVNSLSEWYANRQVESPSNICEASSWSERLYNRLNERPSVPQGFVPTSLAEFFAPLRASQKLDPKKSPATALIANQTSNESVVEAASEAQPDAPESPSLSGKVNVSHHCSEPIPKAAAALLAVLESRTLGPPPSTPLSGSSKRPLEALTRANNAMRAQIEEMRREEEEQRLFAERAAEQERLRLESEEYESLTSEQQILQKELEALREVARARQAAKKEGSAGRISDPSDATTSLHNDPSKQASLPIIQPEHRQIIPAWSHNEASTETSCGPAPQPVESSMSQARSSEDSLQRVVDRLNRGYYERLDRQRDRELRRLPAHLDYHNRPGGSFPLAAADYAPPLSGDAETRWPQARPGTDTEVWKSNGRPDIWRPDPNRPRPDRGAAATAVATSRNEAPATRPEVVIADTTAIKSAASPPKEQIYEPDRDPRQRSVSSSKRTAESREGIDITSSQKKQKTDPSDDDVNLSTSSSKNGQYQNSNGPSAKSTRQDEGDRSSLSRGAETSYWDTMFRAQSSGV